MLWTFDYTKNARVHGKYLLEMMDGCDLKYKEYLHDLSSWSRQTDSFLCVNFDSIFVTVCEHVGLLVKI